MSCVCDKCMNFPCGEEKNMIIVCCDFEEKPKVITNADRIRGMSDEELATFLFTNVGCSDCTMHGGGCSVDCEKWMLSWLQSPAEEVEG